MERLVELFYSFREQNLLLPIWYENGTLQAIDQTKLPFLEKIVTLHEIEELAKAINEMTIRGSGALGISGALGLYLAAVNSRGNPDELKRAGSLLKSTRPTAVNMMKTIDEILHFVDRSKNVAGDGFPEQDEVLLERLETKVIEILKRQLMFEHQLGEHGAALIDDGDTILTHCHSGALAGSGYGGRALSVIRKAFEQGKKIQVIVCETRPYLQGARITAYELKRFGIPFTLITDNMSGYCMSKGMVQKVVVGSDRVARNGDLANKVGTYMHALAAKENGVPFYTATSSHTLDFQTANGREIEVEVRKSQEVTHLNGIPIAPDGTKALYPSFDITPHYLITGIITEKGVIDPPFEVNLKVLQTED